MFPQSQPFVPGLVFAVLPGSLGVDPKKLPVQKSVTDMYHVTIYCWTDSYQVTNYHTSQTVRTPRRQAACSGTHESYVRMLADIVNSRYKGACSRPINCPRVRVDVLIYAPHGASTGSSRTQADTCCSQAPGSRAVRVWMVCNVLSHLNSTFLWLIIKPINSALTVGGSGSRPMDLERSTDASQNVFQVQHDRALCQ